MEIPQVAKKPVLFVASLVILYWIVFFVGGRGHRRPAEVYLTSGVDRVLGSVVAQEAFRLGGDHAQVVLLYRSHEKENGTRLERQAQAFDRGFQVGLYDEADKLRTGIKILARKYQSDEAMLHIDWPPVAFVRKIAHDYPTCNVIVSLCDSPVVKPEDLGSYDPAKLPKIISLSPGIGSPGEWRATFGNHLVEVLFSRRRTPSAQFAKKPREIVEMDYWIITKENLEETIRTAGGRLDPPSFWIKQLTQPIA